MPLSISTPLRPLARAVLATMALGSCVPVAQAQATVPAPAAAASAPPRPAAAPPRAAAAAPPRAASAPTNAGQKVEITGTTQPDSQDERRRSTASRITFGREDLDRMGDATLGEVLKRLPGVTLGGPPGRGGQVRMRGMGGGYTQILIDGQRMAPGFSLDSIAPEQIERIEIMRAPVAEYSARAIAGTINVIMRADFKRKAHELRVGGGADGSHGQAGASWTHNGNTQALGYNLAATLFKGGQGDESDSHTLGLDPDGNTVLQQRVHSQSSNRREGVFANARLQFKLAPGSSLDLQPFLNAFRSRSDGVATLDQAVGTDVPYTRAAWHTESQWQMGRLNGTWATGLGDGGRLQMRFGSTLSSSHSVTDRDESGGTNAPTRTKHDDVRQRELSLDMNGKFSQLIADRHSASAGWELQHSSRTDSRKTLENGVPTLTEFGENIEAKVQRIALFAQDEWEWTKTFSFYVGARWEAIETASDSAVDRVHNRSAVFTPLLHAVWKLPDSPRDQIRASLTRSYRSPNTNQLISRPSINNFQPDTSRPNTATHPDRAGNPALKPELAWGLELGYERYLAEGGVVSANVFYRRIDDLIRTVRSQETVSWATAPRWVARPQNIGQADAAGLELEAKGRLADLVATQLPITLRSNFTLMWSRVGQVMGPNNRLEGQPPWTANVGADWPVKGTPLTWGASLNYTPGFVVQQIDQQAARQGNKRVVDAYAVWRFSPEASARLTLSNLGARRYDTGLTTTLADGSSEATDTAARTFTTVNLRAEFRF